MAVNWGVIGCGGIARRRTIPEGIIPAGNSRLAAVMDADTAVAEEMARELNTTFCRTEKELIGNPEVQAVYLATPAGLHHDQAVRALEAGKHVLVEKPMALTTEDCDEMIEAAEKSGVLLGVGYMMRFHGLHVRLGEMVASGELGTPVLARAQLSCWFPPMEGAWRQYPEQGGGGSLADMGNHCLDLLEHIFRSRVNEINCLTANAVHDYAVEDSALVTARFENGALGIVDALFSVPDASSKNRLEIYGSRGSVLAEGTVGQSPSGEVRAFIERKERGYEAEQERAEEGEETIDFPEINIYRAEIEEFASAIEENRKPMISGEDGRWSQKLLMAAYQSAREGRKINLR